MPAMAPEVYSLGATYSCQHSISYYTDVSMSSNQCLIGISIGLGGVAIIHNGTGTPSTLGLPMTSLAMFKAVIQAM